ncbi:hypothetical protein ScPMuIL_006583, partial [Solemya velum]
FREVMRDALKPEQLMDDYYLTRWLRARNYDCKKAETMLRNSLNWRKQNNVDNLLGGFVVPEVLQKYYPGGFSGVDREGGPVWIDTLGQLDMRGLLRSVKKSDIIMTRIRMGETAYKLFDELTKKTGKRIHQMSVIFDLENFGLKHLWKPGLDTFNEVVQIFEDNYPETTKRVYVVNAPTIFPILFKIVKPFLGEDTIRKIKILGSNYKEELLKEIAPDQLPKCYGGTCTDPDGNPRCLSKICIGGDVPKEYYIKLDTKEMEHFSEVSVRWGSSLQLDYNIKIPNSIIRWQFTTDGYDIGFGVYKKMTEARQKSAEMMEIMVSQRVNSHLVPEDGSITCKETGIYVVRFDNTYSWTRRKTIHYIIEVLMAEEAPDSTMAGKIDDVFTSTQQNGLSGIVNFFAGTDDIHISCETEVTHM